MTSPAEKARAWAESQDIGRMPSRSNVIDGYLAGHKQALEDATQVVFGCACDQLHFDLAAAIRALGADDE